MKIYLLAGKAGSGKDLMGSCEGCFLYLRKFVFGCNTSALDQLHVKDALDVGRRRVEDALQQVYRAWNHAFKRVTDGREIIGIEGAGRDVIKADDRDILRDGFVEFFPNYVHNTQRNDIRSAKNGIRPGVFAQCSESGFVSGGVAEITFLRPKNASAALVHLRREALNTLDFLGDGCAAVENTEGFVSTRHQIVGSLRGCSRDIAIDRAEIGVGNVSVEDDNGDIGAEEGIDDLGAGCAGRDDDCVCAVSMYLRQNVFHTDDRINFKNQHLFAAFLQQRQELFDNVDVEITYTFSDNESDNARSLRKQSARKRIASVITQLICRLQHNSSCFLTDAAVPARIEHSGYGGRGNTGLLRDINDGWVFLHNSPRHTDDNI